MEYDRTLASLLSAIANLTNLQILSFPTEEKMEGMIENT